MPLRLKKALIQKDFNSKYGYGLRFHKSHANLSVFKCLFKWLGVHGALRMRWANCNRPINAPRLASERFLVTDLATIKQCSSRCWSKPRLYPEMIALLTTPSCVRPTVACTWRDLRLLFCRSRVCQFQSKCLAPTPSAWVARATSPCAHDLSARWIFYRVRPTVGCTKHLRQSSRANAHASTCNCNATPHI